MKKKHIIAFDIDGTLLSSNHKFLPSTKQAIEKLILLNNYIILASSRPPKNLLELSNELNLSQKIILSLNGSFIINNDECIFEKNIEYKDVEMIYRKASELNLHISFYSGWEWFVKEKDKWSKEESRIVKLEPKILKTPFNYQINVQKALIIGEAKRVGEFQKEISKKSVNLDAALSKPNYCDVVAKGISKASGLKLIADSLKIKIHDTIAFGDSENDLEMISSAGIGIAMGNGIKKIKKIASFVTDNNDEDGIFNALKRLNII
jgi:Cof subfamily protein (haloacid dehalogenase superfamily)